MKKEIKFSAKLDSAEFDRSIEQMQRKLKEIYAPADAIRQQQQMAGRMDGMGLGGNMSKPSQETYMRATQQSRREIDQMLAVEVKRQAELSKSILERLNTVKALKNEQRELTKNSAEELAIKEKIARMETNNYRLREIERGRSQAIGQTMDVRDAMKPQGMQRLATAFQHGGIGGAATVGMRMVQQLSPVQMAGMVGSVLTATGVAASIGGELYRSYKQAPINTASSYGSAMTGVLGREVNAAYSGKSALEMAFLPEKQRAMQMAREGMSGERWGNIGSLTGSVMRYGGAGVGVGAGYGAAAGALAGAGIASLPGAGIGAVGGGIIGGLGGSAYGLYKGVTGEGGGKNSALAKSMFSDTHNAEYEGMMAQEFAEKYGQALKGLKEQNPYKTAAAEHYDGNYMRHLDTQRSMGMQNNEFHGYRLGAINNGFTDDMAMGASQGILGAGGSSSMARGSVLALQAGRQYNQTNAAGVLGQLSNSLGSSESSKQAYVKMLAEGTRIGLDTSTYAEESRKMMEATASVINKSGVTSQNDIDRLVSQMGGFLANKTNQGVETAKNAFDIYNKTSSEIGGPRGVMRASGFQTSPILSKLDARDRAGLAQIPADQLSEDDPAVQGYARKANVSPKEIINEVLKINKQSFNLTKTTDDAMNKASSIRKELSTLGFSQGNMKYREELEKELQIAEQDYQGGMAYEMPGSSPRDRIAIGKRNTGANDGASWGNINTDGRGGTGRVEDESVAGAAEGSRVVLENFKKFKDDLVPAANSIKEFNIHLNKMVEIIQKLPAAEKAKAMGDLGFNPPQNQQQSGKSEQ